MLGAVRDQRLHLGVPILHGMKVARKNTRAPDAWAIDVRPGCLFLSFSMPKVSPLSIHSPGEVREQIAITNLSRLQRPEKEKIDGRH